MSTPTVDDGNDNAYTEDTNEVVEIAVVVYFEPSTKKATSDSHEP